MQHTAERQTTEAQPQLSKPSPDSASESKLSGFADLKPPHLALAGKRVQPLERITTGDREIITRNRASVCEVLSFGIRHGLTDKQELVSLLNAPYIEQPDLARAALSTTFQNVAGELGDDESHFVLSSQESPFCRGRLGLFIRPTDLLTLLRPKAPDPVLSDWYERFVKRVSKTLGFMTTRDMLAYEWDMQTDMLLIEPEQFISNREQIRELLESESLEEIVSLLRMGGDWFESMMDEEDTEQAISRLLCMDELLRQENDDEPEPDTFTELYTELQSIVARIPRLRSEPTVKKLLDSLPEIVEASAFIGDALDEVLESAGDRYIGEHFVIDDMSLPDELLGLVDDHGNHLYEVGDLGCWAINTHHPDALKITQAYVLIASKFFDVCDHIY